MSEPKPTVVERLRTIEALSPGDWGDAPEGAFDPEPPRWATDPFNEDEANQCGYCGGWMEVVRPGKVQCNTCWDGRNVRFLVGQVIRDIEAPPSLEHLSDDMEAPGA